MEKFSRKEPTATDFVNGWTDTANDPANKLAALKMEVYELKEGRLRNPEAAGVSTLEQLRVLNERLPMCKNKWDAARYNVAILETELAELVVETGNAEAIVAKSQELDLARELETMFNDDVALVENELREITQTEGSAEAIHAKQEELNLAREQQAVFHHGVVTLENDLARLIEAAGNVDEIQAKQEELELAREQEALFHTQLVLTQVQIAEMETAEEIFPDTETHIKRKEEEIDMLAKTLSQQQIAVTTPPPSPIEVPAAAMEERMLPGSLNSLLELEKEILVQESLASQLSDKYKEKEKQVLATLKEKRVHLENDSEFDSVSKLEAAITSLRAIVSSSQKAERTIAERVLRRLVFRFQTMQDDIDKAAAFQRKLREIEEKKNTFGLLPLDSQNPTNNSLGSSPGVVRNEDAWGAMPDFNRRDNKKYQ